MRYYSQLEVEKMLEYLYDRQCATVPATHIEECGPILETRALMMKFSHDNAAVLNYELGNCEARPEKMCNGNCREIKN